jgi:hypothetical protein
VLLDLFQALRPTVEAAAARKFAAGSIKPDGTVVVLTLASNHEATRS